MPVGLNRLVEALSPLLRTQLLSIAKAVDLPQHASLYQADEPLHCVYLLTSGFASVAVSVRDGGSAEIGIIGPEGIVGSSVLLGSYPPVTHCFMQTPGTAWRIMTRMTQQQALMVDQIAACNKLHLASERLARWLLTAADRLESESVQLTQESLSQMLGTRRTTVALVAGSLQRRGLIRYRRGTVQIVDRAGLEEAACDCYRIVHRLSKSYAADSPRQ